MYKFIKHAKILNIIIRITQNKRYCCHKYIYIYIYIYINLWMLDNTVYRNVHARDSWMVWWLYLDYDIDIRNYIYEFMKQVKILSVVIHIINEWYLCYENKKCCYNKYTSCEDKFVEYIGYFNVVGYDYSYNMLLHLGICISPHCVSMHFIVKTGN